MTYLDSARALFTSAALCALAAHAPAGAQTAPVQPAAAPDLARPAEAGLGDIVVTARRREEALQDVPVAITALSGETLTARGVISAEALRQTAPALNIYQNNRQDAGFYIRGQGPGIVGGGARNFTSVATYFAEVPTAIAGSGVFYDLANVQVLKGPQGTLFGRNTTGGAVLFEPNRPTFEFGGSIKGSYGNYDFHEIEGVLNVPIVEDRVALRLAGSYSRRKGFTRGVYTGQRADSRNHDAFRVSLLLKPTDTIENLTIVDYNFRDNTGSGLILRAANPAAQLGALPVPAALQAGFGLPASLPLLAGAPTPIACLSVALPGCPTGPFGNAVAAFVAGANGGLSLSGLTPQQFADAVALQRSVGIRRSLSRQPVYNRNKAYGITNRTEIELSDAISIKNIIALRRNRTAEVNDIAPGLDYAGSQYPGTGSNPPYIRGLNQFSEEFQLQGRLADGALSYVLGFYHEQTKPGIDQSYRSVVFGNATNTANYFSDKSDAVFAHLEWQATEAFQLSGGFRYTWDKRYLTSSVTNDAGVCGQLNTANGLIECPVSGRAKFSAPTYDVTAQYELSQRVLAYAAYRRGYKSGGFNLPAPTLETSTFGKETVDDFEVGLKADWDIGVPLRTNLSLFHDKYKGIQIALPVLTNGTFISLVQNAGKATNKGGELEVSIKPSADFTIGGFASYLDAKCATNVGTACRVGRQIAFQPHWKAGVNAQYTIFDGTNGALTLSSDFSYTDKVTTSDPDAPIDTYPSYTLWNARLDWSDAFAPGVDLAVFATNITGKKYIVGGYPLVSALGFDSVLYGEPRMYGASVRFRFGN
ncbi:TonB-dependent receptor [Sphingomonas jatrophae]|uniref:Iron complex outermembrane recepter protein n=1 Tax=Sphingomonas jatrophae TaxID=1166337 RepID=A0A1I6KBG6_9SPHN|nr:TonB-dependent receptor [Sphingomonas jatrophae]SFR88593.1 iron complex outermembrane recepter protein [Sphingomonas jatrophae]